MRSHPGNLVTPPTLPLQPSPPPPLPFPSFHLAPSVPTHSTPTSSPPRSQPSPPPTLQQKQSERERARERALSMVLKAEKHSPGSLYDAAA